MVFSSFSEFKLDLVGTENMDIGDSLCKRVSAGGDYPWTIFCYPRGFTDEDCGDYVSLKLYMPTNPRISVGVVIVFEAFVIGTLGFEPVTYQEKRTAKVSFGDGAFFYSVSWDRFLKRSHLGSSFQDTNGVVTIMCGIIVQCQDDDIGCIAVPGSDIGSHLSRILGCADGSDVSFLIAGETFPAHRAVLAARSPVFRAELFGPRTAQLVTPIVTLGDIDPATFKLLLHFVYTDTLAPAAADTEPAVNATFQRLLAAADRYELDGLKLLCAQKLWNNVTADTVADVLGTAEMHGCPELKEKCMDFFVAEHNFKRAMLTEGFVRLGQRFPSIIAQLRQRAGV